PETTVAPERAAGSKRAVEVQRRRVEWRKRLEAAFDRRTVVELDRGEPVGEAGRALLGLVITELIDAEPDLRATLLRELARVDLGLGAAAWATLRAADLVSQSDLPAARLLLEEMRSGARTPS